LLLKIECQKFKVKFKVKKKKKRQGVVNLTHCAEGRTNLCTTNYYMQLLHHYEINPTSCRTVVACGHAGSMGLLTALID
jgi:hypothetical protein